MRVSDAEIQNDRFDSKEGKREEASMEYEIDVSRLRRDMKDYYGTTIYS